MRGGSDGVLKKRKKHENYQQTKGVRKFTACIPDISHC